MTTVLALARDGEVVMAADSRSNVYDRVIPGVHKILRLKEGKHDPNWIVERPRRQILIGFSGRAALVDLVLAHLTFELPGDPTDQENCDAWAAALARSITDLAVEARLTDDGELDGSFLIGWAGQLWHCSHQLAMRMPDGISAVGSGEGYAIGALDALLNCDVPPGDAVARACQMAVTRDCHSDGPINVHLLPMPLEA